MYDDYVKSIFNENDMGTYIEVIEKDILERQEAKLDFISKARERIEKIKEYEESGKCEIVGRTFKEGRKKCILLIVRYPDLTQRDEHYEFTKISDMRIKLAELKEKYSAFAWDKFREEI